MLESALEHHRDSSRLLTDVAVRHAQYGNIDSALKVLERLLDQTPSMHPIEPIARITLICFAKATATDSDYSFQPLPPNWQPLHAPIVLASAALGHLNSLLARNTCNGIDRSRLTAGLNVLLSSMPVARMKGNLDNWTLFFEAARTALLANEPDMFVHYMKIAMTLDPTRPEAGGSLIVHYLQQDKRDLALATFDAMITSNPVPDRRFSEDIQRLKSLLWPKTD